MFRLKKGFTFIIRVNKSRRRIWVGMSQIWETRDTVTKFSMEILAESKHLGVINSNNETGKKLVQITSARRSVSGPGARLYLICLWISR